MNNLGWTAEELAVFEKLDLSNPVNRAEFDLYWLSKLHHANPDFLVTATRDALNVLDQHHPAKARQWREIIAKYAPEVVPSAVARFWDRFGDRTWSGDEVRRIPAPEPLVAGVLDRGQTSLLVAPSGLGKTFVGLSLGYAIAGGHDWFDHEVTAPGPVFYFLGEGVSGAGVRSDAWARYHDRSIPAAFNLVGAAPDLSDGAVVADLIAWAADVRPAFVVFDTLARVSGTYDESNPVHMTRLMSVGAELGRFGTHTMFVHHTGKSNEGYRGSSALYGAADAVLSLFPSRDAVDGRFSMAFTKRKDGDQGLYVPFELDVPDGLAAPVLKPPTQGSEAFAPIEHEELRVFRALYSVYGLDEFSRHDFRTVVKDTLGIPRATADRRMTALKRNGSIVHVSGKEGTSTVRWGLAPENAREAYGADLFNGFMFGVEPGKNLPDRGDRLTGSSTREKE